MGKIYMAELADILAQKTGVSKREAQQFLSALVETIQDGVNDDKLVKLKGLGTFKVIDVDARESVNVNTGERVVINSHQKLSFTPDAVMKDLVNKPFSQFETVVLNEGVEFEDEPELEEPTETEELLLSPKDEVMPGPEVEEVASTPEIAKEEVVPNPVEEVCKEKTLEMSIVEPFMDKEKNSSYWWLWLLLAIVACVICFAGGYILGRHIDYKSIFNGESSTDTTTQIANVVVKEKKTIDTDTAKFDTVKVVSDVKDNSSIIDAKKIEVEPDWKKYEKMDVRVRTGAYGIIGTDRVEKVRQGDTTKRIAKRTLGEGMECYIEVYNNITSNDLKEGQDIKIPKLKLKKLLKTE